MCINIGKIFIFKQKSSQPKNNYMNQIVIKLAHAGNKNDNQTLDTEPDALITGSECKVMYVSLTKKTRYRVLSRMVYIKKRK